MAETKAPVRSRGEEGRSLDDARKPVSVAEIIRHGERLSQPKVKQTGVAEALTAIVEDVVSAAMKPAMAELEEIRGHVE